MSTAPISLAIESAFGNTLTTDDLLFTSPVQPLKVVRRPHDPPQRLGQLHHRHRVVEPGVEPLDRPGRGPGVVGRNLVAPATRLRHGLRVEHLRELAAQPDPQALRRGVDDVAGEVGLAALPGRLGEHGLQRGDEPLVRVGGREPDPDRPRRRSPARNRVQLSVVSASATSKPSTYALRPSGVNPMATSSAFATTLWPSRHLM